MHKERTPYDPSQSLARRAMDKCDHLSFELDELRRLMIRLGHDTRKQTRLIAMAAIGLAFSSLAFAGFVIFCMIN